MALNGMEWHACAVLRVSDTSEGVRYMACGKFDNAGMFITISSSVMQCTERSEQI